MQAGSKRASLTQLACSEVIFTRAATRQCAGAHLPAFFSVLASSLLQARPQWHNTAGPSTSSGPSLSDLPVPVCGKGPASVYALGNRGVVMLAAAPPKLKLCEWLTV